MKGILLKKIILFLFIFSAVNAQQTTKNNYGLNVIDDPEIYLSIAEKDSNKLFIDLEKYIPGIVLDIRYATKNNFTGEAVYNISKAFLRLPAANALKKIQEELNKENLGLKIFDGYRPYSVTVKFYELIGDPEFVASPEKGSRHNRGCAVDLTLIDLNTGEEIPMPTGYDDFTEEASHSFNELPEEAIANREKLKKIMTENGFEVYPSEW